MAVTLIITVKLPHMAYKLQSTTTHLVPYCFNSSGRGYLKCILIPERKDAQACSESHCCGLSICTRKKFMC